MSTRGSLTKDTVGGTLTPEPDGTGGGTGEEQSDLLEQKQADKDEGCGPLGDLLHRLPSGMRP